MYDIGCGNGKYFNNHRHFMFGCDVSPRLLEYASRRNPNVDLMASDVLNLPIRSSSCDAFLCIAVLHHLSSN
jgi:alkylated DNA repair protein alkB family protein 8